MAVIVPPGGFAGNAQMTPASRTALASGLRMQRATKSRSGKKAKKRYNRNKRIKAGKAVRMKKPRKARGSKLRKGSPEAKAFMAALRKKRKK